MNAQMDHAFGRGRAALQAFEILEGAALDVGAGGGHFVRRGVRAREAENRMARADRSATTAEPMKPLAPVTKIRMGISSPGWTCPSYRPLCYPGKYVSLYLV